MPTTYNSKVVLSDGTTLIDLTSDTVTASGLLQNVTAHDRSGAPIVGSCTYDADTSDANATASEILYGQTAYINGVKLTGSMPNNGGTGGTISTLSPYTIPAGYSDGSATVGISSSESAKLIPGNIKSGITVLGVTGNYSGEAVTAHTKSATPTFSAQTVLPDTGYDYLSEVDIAAIPVVYTQNAAGGYTVTIG